MNKVQITGKIQQIMRDPGQQRYTHGVMTIEGKEDEAMLTFPPKLSFPPEIVGKYMTITGKLHQDEIKDMYIKVTHMVPCSSRFKPLKEKPAWWEGNW